MARAAGDDTDKALWITLAQSWARLAEHVAQGGAGEQNASHAGALATEP